MLLLEEEGFLDDILGLLASYMAELEDRLICYYNTKYFG
jgi:hypothetical protein